MPYKDPEAQKAAQRRHYEANRERYIEAAHINRTDRRRRLVAYVRSCKEAPCTDCGQQFHYAAMEFDHVRGDKVDHVATMAHKGVSLERLQDEIAKCELVCANCHRVRTWARMGEDGLAGL